MCLNISINSEGFEYMRQAFIHKSISSKTGNYELMEFEGGYCIKFMYS